MNRFLIFLGAIFFSGPLFCQVFKKVETGLQLYSDSTMTSKVSEETYASCNCKPEGQRGRDGKIWDTLYFVPVIDELGEMAVFKNDFWGSIDQDGSVRHPFVLKQAFYRSKYGYRYDLIRGDQNYVRVIQEEVGDTIGTFGEIRSRFDSTLIVIDKKGYMGLLSIDFDTILPFDYSCASWNEKGCRFSKKGWVPIKDKEGNFGITDAEGNFVIPLIYDHVGFLYNEDTIYVYKDKKGGYVNGNGDILLPLRYKKLPEKLADINYVQDDRHTWFMDRSFQPVGEKYEVLEKKGELFFFKKNGKWGVMDDQLKLIVAPLYGTIMDGPRLRTDRTLKTYVVTRGKKYGLIGESGELLVVPDYDCVCGLSYFAPNDYYIEFKKGPKFFRFDPHGQLLEQVSTGQDACICSENGSE